MKKISLWAKNNKGSARFMIISIYVVLNIIGITVGRLLSDLYFSISATTFSLFIFLFFAGIMAYPLKRNKKTNTSSFYIRQKGCDIILAFSSFFMIVYVGNNYNNLSGNYASINAAVNTTLSFPADSIIKSYKSISSFSKSMKDDNGKQLTWKEKKKLLKKQIKGIQASKEDSTGSKTLLIILSVLAALGLLYLLAMLSCSISCSGGEGIAIVVAALGTAAIVFLLIRVIRGITRKRNKEKPATQPSN